MKKKLLEEIKSISFWDYVYVTGLQYNTRQLKNYLADLKDFNNLAIHN